MPGRINLSPGGIENLRRSVVMLTPGSANAVNREDAMVLLEEIQRLQGRNGLLATMADTLAELEQQVRALLEP